MDQEKRHARQALRNFKRLLTLEPGHVGHLEQLAKLSLELGEPRQAARYFLQRAEVLVEREERGAALASVRAALQCDPTLSRAEALMSRLQRSVPPGEILLPADEALSGDDLLPINEALLAAQDPVLRTDEIVLEEDEGFLPEERFLPARRVRSSAPADPAAADSMSAVAARLSAALDLSRSGLTPAIARTPPKARDTWPGDSEEEPATRVFVRPQSGQQNTLDIDDDDVIHSGEAELLNESLDVEAEQIVEVHRTGHTSLPPMAMPAAESAESTIERMGAGQLAIGPAQRVDEVPEQTAPQRLPSPLDSLESDYPALLSEEVSRPITLQFDGDDLLLSPIFADLPREALRDLLDAGERQTARIGTPIVSSGDRFDGPYVVLRGRVTREKDADARRKAMLSPIDAGGLLGVVEVVRGGRWRAASRAERESELLLLPIRAVDAVRARYRDWERALRVTAQRRMADFHVSGSGLFGHLDAAHRLPLVDRFLLRQFVSGDTLMKRGLPADGLFLIVAGEVDVEQDDAYLTTLGAGDFVGAVTALGREPAPMRATAATP
ncbi:MAG: cyclic nucleotide-binding domain-containing protein, partial [Myxococcales bacterium]|nr:cyclic nucleotide-binding domain-containing protein [Myxococcales bacterium]